MMTPPPTLNLRRLHLLAIALLLSCAAFAQSPATAALIARARAQEQAGRTDLAAQTWQQVLLIHPQDHDALLGLARAAKLDGRDADARRLLDQLRQLSPSDPKLTAEIEAVEHTASTKSQNAALQQAAQLAKEGKTEEALRAYRAVFGPHPPDGDWALAYYDTEASLEPARADAIANLRALARKYPADPRYSITLGRILTYTPQTRPEGIRLLNQFSQDNTAQQALRQALAWDAKNPASAPQIAGYLKQHPDSELEHALADTEARAAGQQRSRHEDELSDERSAELWAEVQRGTAALTAGDTEAAIAAYKAALAIRPATIEALNGLAGSYQKAGQPAQAVPVFRQIVKLRPASVDAWRGLFDAQIQSNQPAEALETARQLPPAARTALQHDLGYLRSLAAAYRATGKTTDAESTLAQALSLPVPAGARAQKTDTRLQYAGLLVEARRYAQAAGIYREILYDDPENIPAWQGLIDVQHQSGHDAEAVATVDRMSPAAYDAALEDPGFLAMLAGIYQQQNRLDTAADLLHRAARFYAARHQTSPLPLQLQLASIYLQQNNPEPAYAIFRSVLAAQPASTAAWKGLIQALHQSHRDRDALAQLRTVPANVRHSLDRDIDYDQAVAGIYAATGNNAAALQLIAQIQQFYRSQRTPTPAEIDIQNVWLLYNTHDDRDLYRALMALGDREDLTDPQRLSVQSLWGTWSVRRAGEAVDAGNSRRALEILSVAAQAFPGNSDVSKALAAGYLKAGDARTAMSIYTALHLANASASDYQGMVGAALAIPNLRQAELWLREALSRFPNDPQVLALAARFEEARGDHARSSRYWKASLAAAPAADPANRLAHTLDRADTQPARAIGSTGLASLLDPETDLAARPQRPALPSYHNSPHASSAFETSAALYGPDPTTFGAAPIHPGDLAPSQPGDRLREYVPQADLLPLTPSPHPVTEASDAAEAFAPPDLLHPATQTGAETASIPSTPRPTQTTPFALDSASSPLSTRPHPVLPEPSQDKALDASTRAPEALPPTPLPNSLTDSLTGSGTLTSTTPFFLQPQTKSVLAAFTPPALMPLDDQLRAVADPAAITLTPPQTPSTDDTLTDLQLAQRNLPPLRGPWSPQPASPSTQPDAHDLAAQQIATLDAGYSPWNGGSGYVTHRSGTAGFDELYILESPFETSRTVGESARLTAIVAPAFLASGQSDGTSTTFALGTLADSAIPAQQNASGVGGELQLSTASVGLAAGTSPRGFLVSNFIGRFELHPPSSPLKLTFNREAVKDSQLSYSGLNDPGTATTTNPGNPWGGVVANAANLQYGRGDAKSGYYAGLGGQYLTGLHVLANRRYDGVAGAYWKLLDTTQSSSPSGSQISPLTASQPVTLTLGANFFGMHYDHNLRFFSYGQGGYFSPDVYFLASLPLTLTGQYGPNLHYTFSGALGLQAFQEDTTLYYPLQPGSVGNGLLRTRSGGLVLPAIPIAPAQANNPTYPGQSVVGSNYDLHAEVSAHLVDRWYVGGFVSLNNTRNYASQTAGFFLRYMGRPSGTDELPPAGLFPATGQRPLMVP